MSVVYLTDDTSQQTIQERLRATVQTNENIRARSGPISQKRHLDVDGVLERSLRRVAGEEQIGPAK